MILSMAGSSAVTMETASSADDALELMLVDALDSDSEASQARPLGTFEACGCL